MIEKFIDGDHAGSTIAARARSRHVHERMKLRFGEQLVGKYELIDLLGEGGLGVVVAARHIHIDRPVALKFLRPECARDPDLVDSFVWEARAGYHIDSAHVVRVFELEKLHDGTPFIVMERLRGSDLRQVLSRAGSLTAEQACRYARQACAGLRAAHELGVIHRDIKPENLFVVSSSTAYGGLEEHIKLLDFGSAGLQLGAEASMTHDHPFELASGAPHYLSPEQVRASANLDARTDIWSLGCVLYEMLSGTSPFERFTSAESCAAILKDEPRPLSEVRPELPVGLSEVVMLCLRKDADQRWESAEALSIGLARFEHSTGVARQGRGKWCACLALAIAMAASIACLIGWTTWKSRSHAQSRSSGVSSHSPPAQAYWSDSLM